MTTARGDPLKRITARPDVFNGKPIIRDMRISVELILSLLSQGAPYQELLDDWPELEHGDILGLYRLRARGDSGRFAGAGVGGIGGGLARGLRRRR